MKKVPTKLKTVEYGGTEQFRPLFENLDQTAPRGGQEWLSPDEACEYLRVTKGSLRNMTMNGDVPSYKLGDRVRYLKHELRALLLGKRRGA